jgi:hypothetical protein
VERFPYLHARLLRQDCLRCGWPTTQCGVRPLRVVFHAPPLRQKCLLQRVKYLAVQELVAQLPVEALAVPVLPPTPRLDVQSSRAHPPATSNSSAITPVHCPNECALVFRAPNITSANVSIACKLPKRAEPYSVYSIDSPHDPVGRDFPGQPIPSTGPSGERSVIHF